MATWRATGSPLRLLLVLFAVVASGLYAQNTTRCGMICEIPVEKGGCTCNEKCECKGRVPAQEPASLPKPGTPVAVAGGACGPNNIAVCSNQQCCSSGGNYCGITVDHCVGTSCLAGWGHCGQEYVQRQAVLTPEEASKGPSATTILAQPGGACGPLNNAMCPGGQCCSVHGYCGVTPEHCDASQGCLELWSGRRCNGQSSSSAGGSSSSSSSGSSLPPDRIATVIGTTLGGTCALIGLSYTLWKWYHKHRALQINSFIASHSSGGSTGSSPSISVWPPKVKALTLNSSNNSSRSSSRLGGSQDDLMSRKDRQAGPSTERAAQ